MIRSTRPSLIRIVSRPFTALALCALAACGTGSSPDSGKPAATVQQPIIGGSFDTTHTGVVYLQSATGACSGTIVKVDTAQKVGWILTAAHCVTPAPEVIVQANDAADEVSGRTYEVIDSHANPAYDNQAFTHDVAIVRFYGASAKTPVIPMATAPDGLTTGKAVTSVGYGRTTPSNQPPDSNSKRKSIGRTISNLTSALVTYSLSGGGICSGDSGGPVLYTSGGVERVVAVHSNVSGECLGDGHSMRVTNETSFINQELARALPNLATCDACTKISNSGDEICANKFRACRTDSACKGYYDCIVKCGGATTKCQDTCRASNPGGAAMFNGVLNCGCVDTCQTACASQCTSVPKCGYKFGKSCETCLNAACCAEEKTAASDRVGYVCLAEGGGDRCVDSDAWLGFSACQRANCAEACGVEPLPDPEASSGEPGPADAGTGSSGNNAAPGEATTDSSGCTMGSGASSSSAAALGLLLALAAARKVRRRSVP